MSNSRYVCSWGANSTTSSYSCCAGYRKNEKKKAKSISTLGATTTTTTNNRKKRRDLPLLLTLCFLFPPFSSKQTQKQKNSAELIPRSAVLDAHAEERAAGLGDGDIDDYKALVVECALLFCSVFSIFFSFFVVLRFPSFCHFFALIIFFFYSRKQHDNIDIFEVARHSGGALRQW